MKSPYHVVTIGEHIQIRGAHRCFLCLDRLVGVQIHTMISPGCHARALT